MNLFGPKPSQDTCKTCEEALATAALAQRQVKQLALDFEELLDKVTRASQRARKRVERDEAAEVTPSVPGSGDNPGAEGDSAAARIWARRNRLTRMRNGVST